MGVGGVRGPPVGLLLSPNNVPSARVCSLAAVIFAAPAVEVDDRPVGGLMDAPSGYLVLWI